MKPMHGRLNPRLGSRRRTTPWNARQRFRRVDREWDEDICAENNADFLHYEVVPLPHVDRPHF
jgi:hypothetical protein